MAIYKKISAVNEAELDSVQTPDDVGNDLDQIEKDIVGDNGFEAHADDVEAALTGVVGDPLEECYQLMYESTYNYNQLLKVIGLEELAAATSNRVLVLEAADIKGFFAKFKETLKAWWSKIVEFMQKFIYKLKARLSTGKEFLAENDAAIRAGFDALKADGKLEREVVKYDVEGATDATNPEKIFGVLSSELQKGFGPGSGFRLQIGEKHDVDEDKAKILTALSAGTKVKSIGDYRKYLVDGMSENKDTIGNLGVDYFVDAIKNDGLVKDVQDKYNSLKTLVANALKEVDRLERNLLDEKYDGDVTGTANYFCTMINFFKDCGFAFLSAYTGAVNNRMALAQNCVRSFAAAGKNVKKDSTPAATNESFKYSSIFGTII